MEGAWRTQAPGVRKLKAIFIFALGTGLLSVGSYLTMDVPERLAMGALLRRDIELIAGTAGELSAATVVIAFLACGLCILVLCRQLAQRLRAQDELSRRDEELTRQNERLDIALENMSQGLCLFDSSKRLVVCNRRYADLYQIPVELSRPGTSFRDILEQRILSGNYVAGKPESYVEERLRAVEERVPSTKVQELKDGRVVAIAHRPLPDGGWVATHEDITELQRIQAKVAHMAKHDALTDLPNRILLRERIQWALLGRRKGVGFAFLYLDLDRFKSVNDTLGHPVGDELLKAVAERLRACVREGDTIARLGGDEFAVVQLSQDLPKDASALANRICDAIRRPFELGGHHIVIETSIGIAIAPHDGDDADQLLKNADMALYGAKNIGRGVFRFFEPEMDARMRERRQLEVDLRRAVEASEFEIHYQPIVSARTQNVTGFEALVRWRHPERGLIPPDAFVPAAEESGLIVQLGEWVLRQACAEAAGWPGNASVAVNLSPVQFKSSNLVAIVMNALAATGLSPARLELEITESVLLQDNAATLRTLHQLRAIGVKIAMDDFGTGYSSLSYLRSFPFDKIKIDRSFVSGLSNTEGSVAILRAVAKLGSSLGMVTTAEGVETREQLERICAEGYNEIQGYFFSPPRSAEEISKLYFDGGERRVAAG
jgi:diguanylate cyclase (GGDEF)-like protein